MCSGCLAQTGVRALCISAHTDRVFSQALVPKGSELGLLEWVSVALLPAELG